MAETATQAPQECNDPATGQKLAQLIAKEIVVPETDEKARLITHASTCKSCGDYHFKRFLEKYL